ncbi:MAG: P1 family peptidase [Acidobacteria bacterium]|nr:P1 family peptidase [Acidobacteriota bacterium]
MVAVTPAFRIRCEDFRDGIPVRVIICCVLAIWGISVPAHSARPAEGSLSGAEGGLTAIDGLKVGHHTLTERPTGCTVVLAEAGATAAVDVRGSAPGTRETALLDPTNTVQQVHAIVLAGGSAFGLAASDGVMRYLEERGVGYETRFARVPIVPAAILYDLGVGGDAAIRPTADCGYRAARSASDGPVAEGSVGAGAGATVGKLAGPGLSMKGGIGTALVELPGGIRVAALMAVNAVGDIVDPDTGAIVAGARTADGLGFADARTILRGSGASAGRGEHTTIGVVATNAALDKAQLALLARMAHDGLARAVRPAHTPADGDAIFAVATGAAAGDASLLQLGAAAADATAAAIVRGVRAATGLPGYPSVRDLQGGVS